MDGVSVSILLSCKFQVLMKDIVTPVPPEEVRNVIKKCLENAALVNYTRISEYAKIEGNVLLRNINMYSFFSNKAKSFKLNV